MSPSAKFCVSGMRRSVQGLRCRALTTAHSVSAVRRKGKGQLRSVSRPTAAIPTLLGQICSSTTAEPPQKSRIIMEEGMRDRVG